MAEPDVTEEPQRPRSRAHRVVRMRETAAPSPPEEGSPQGTMPRDRDDPPHRDEVEPDEPAHPERAIRLTVTLPADELSPELVEVLQFLEGRSVPEMVADLVRDYFRDRRDDPEVLAVLDATERYRTR